MPVLYQVLTGNTADITRPLPHLAALKLDQWPGTSNEITDAGLAHLARWNSLRFAWIVSPPLSDRALSLLANHKDLRWLTVRGNFTDQGLRHLESLRQLLVLRVWSPKGFSPLAVQRLRDHLPGLNTLTTGKGP